MWRAERHAIPEHVPDDSRQDHQEHRSDFEKAREQRPILSGLEVLGGEHALDVGLIGAPVPDTENRVSQQDGEPRIAIQFARCRRTPACSMLN